MLGVRRGILKFKREYSGQFRLIIPSYSHLVSISDKIRSNISTTSETAAETTGLIRNESLVRFRPYTLVEVEEFIKMKRSEIVSRFPQPKVIQEIMIDDLNYYLQCGKQECALVAFNRLHPDYTGIESRHLLDLMRTAGMGRVGRYSRALSKIKQLELFHLVSRFFGTERGAEHYSWLLDELLLSRMSNRRVLEIWDEEMAGGVKFDLESERWGKYSFRRFRVIIEQPKPRFGNFERNIRARSPPSSLCYS
ncbi:hypothetical protein HK098_008042, partial [Nowakowskiella sp. JEL0407]